MARRAAHGQTELARLTMRYPDDSTGTILVMSSGKVLLNHKPKLGPSRGWKLSRAMTEVRRTIGTEAFIAERTSKGWTQEKTS